MKLSYVSPTNNIFFSSSSIKQDMPFSYVPHTVWGTCLEYFCWWNLLGCNIYLFEELTSYHPTWRAVLLPLIEMPSACGFLCQLLISGINQFLVCLLFIKCWTRTVLCRCTGTQFPALGRAPSNESRQASTLEIIHIQDSERCCWLRNQGRPVRV